MDQLTIEQLKNKKRGHKSVVTRYTNKVQEALRENIQSNLSALRDLILNALNEVESTNDFLIIKTVNEGDKNSLFLEMADYKLQVMSTVYRLEIALKTFIVPPPAPPQPPQGVPIPNIPVPTVSMKLPKLDIKKFEGDITEWTSFFEIFNVSVHQRTDMEMIQKFSYLKNLLQGEALELITGFKLESANYTQAIDLLKRTYGKKEEIKLGLVKKLLHTDLPSNDAESLMKFRSQFECSIRSLEAENLELNELYTILLYTKLPSSISETIKRKCGDNWLQFDSFKTQLEEEIHNLRAFSQKPSERVSTISTFEVEQGQATGFSQSVRYKNVGRGREQYRSKETQKKKCVLCEGSHFWAYCKTFTTRERKLEKLKALELCFVCGSPKHYSKDCSKTSCKNGCSFRHHQVICPKTKKEEQGNKQGNKVSVSTLSVAGVNKGDRTKRSILPTATITLKGRRGRVEHKRGLLDPCAERTFVKRISLEKLSYKVKGKEKLALRGYISSKPVQEYEIVTLGIPHKGRLLNLDCVVVDEMPEYVRKFNVKKTLKSLCRKKINLADKDFDLPVEKQNPIELLIGVDNVYNILHPGYRRLDELILLPTIFGYVLTGTCQAVKTEESQVTILKLASNEINANLEDPGRDLKSLWEMDHLGIKEDELSLQERSVLENFEDTIEYSELECQYRVSLPWKGNKKRLSSNFGLALNRLKSQCSKFREDSLYLQNYSKVMSEQESRGFIERVPDWDLNEHCHFLAHHGVKKESRTTPIRVVYDCSARQGKNGLSLNDCLWTGPHITADLLKVLLQLRTHAYACTSDIEKAFLMVQLKEEDRRYTRFLWLEDPRDPESKLIVFQFRVVLFGATCSPFLLNATIKKHLSGMNTKIDHIYKGLYVDNLLFTCNDSEGLIQYFFEVNKMFAKAHLYLKEWISNNENLRIMAESYRIHGEVKENYRVLGLNWNVTTDELSVQPAIMEESSMTKRTILKMIARVFDPLGIFLPVTIKARIFLQKLWKQKLGWDNELNEELMREWSEIRDDLRSCLKLTIPRSTSLGKGDVLHVFCDASESAYGCAVYRVNKQKKISRLLVAKARVAPLKELSVPRLELMALLIASRLLKFIYETYDKDEFDETIVWSDSKSALAWLVSKNTQTVFVRNRVEEINSVIPKSALSYVPTDDNPSDYVTRGKRTEDIENNSFWWEGPSWLRNSAWSMDRSWIHESHMQEDVGVLVNTEEDLQGVQGTQETSLLEWDRYSKVRKFFRTMAWILRFTSNCKKAREERLRNRALQRVTQMKEVTELQELTLEEEKEAARRLIICLQKEYFPDEYEKLKKGMRKPKSALISQLNLYLDNDVIRCKGRLEHAQLPETVKFPILLPKKCYFTQVVIRQMHETVVHMGVNATVAEFRQQYWAPQLRQLVKRVLHRCVICKKVQGKPYRTNMLPPLPEFRLHCKTPFEVTGVDYTGALWVRGYNKTLEKAYVILFTCPVTRALHVELVSNLSCDSFLMAFRKFCSRRTYPSLMLSDNATTFVAAADYLKGMSENSRVQQHLQEVECKWQFIPARAPWFGAIWERLIGLLKNCLKKVLGNALLSFEELSCVLTELEGSVNDRPLSYVPGELNQLEPLTPNHLLCGRKHRIFPKETVDWKDVESDPNYEQKILVEKRYMHVSHVCDNLWKRWEREYLASLRETHNTGVEHSAWPSIGEIVLVKDEGPRSKWKLGQVIELHVGKDKIARVATIRTVQNQLVRPIVNLYPLELKQEVQSAPATQEPSEQDHGRPSRKAAKMAAETRKALIEAGHL